MAVCVALHAPALGMSYWIDEAISVGIASHGLLDIPSVLRMDGSPPLYYLLLHAWMQTFGGSDVAAHALSLVLATLCVPAGLWVAGSLWGPLSGWACAALFALNPFVGAFATETRMYTLVALLVLLTTGCALHAFVHGRRRYLPWALAGLVALLYTHNWALFYIAGLLAALALLWWQADPPARRRVARDGALLVGGALALWLPWVPTFLYQALNTGAPWAKPPSLGGLISGPARLLGREGSTVALLLVGGAGLAPLLRRPWRKEGLAAVAVIAIGAGMLLCAWTLSQASPVWTSRYLIAALPAMLLISAIGLTRVGRLGAVALALAAVLWLAQPPQEAKSNALPLANLASGLLRSGDVVMSTQPEQVPPLARYLPAGLRFVTPLGPVRDTGVTDWRDGMQRLEAGTVERRLEPVVARLPLGSRVLLVRPVISRPENWEAPWGQLVRWRSAQYADALARDPRMLEVYRTPPGFGWGATTGMEAVLYQRVAPAVR
jgi:hypothetical protein